MQLDAYLVREVTPDAADLEALVRHRVGMFTDMGTAVAAGDLPQFRQWFVNAFASGVYRAWFAVAPDGAIAAGGGVAIVLWPPGPGGTDGALPFVYNVYTEPEHRRRGAARLIMTKIHEWCRASGYRRIGLAASRFGEPLYLDMGYQPPPQPFLFLDLPSESGNGKPVPNGGGVHRPSPEPESDAQHRERSAFLRAAACGVRYLGAIRGRRVAPLPADVDAVRGLGGPVPETESSAADVIDLLDRVGSPATVANSGGRYFGFVNGGALPAARAAMVLAAAWDQNVGLRTMSPVAAALEEICLEWLCDILKLPAGCGGAFVTGATMANFACLASARHALLARSGWDVEANGLWGAPPLTVVVGEDVHASLLKALTLLGFGRERVVRVPADAQGRMRPELLPPLSSSTIVCVQAGNVNTGAFDPFEGICAAATAAGAWVHVDGAFGLWAAASPARAHLAIGAGRASSWATDAHKWLNVPYDCGVAIVRQGEALRNAMHLHAPYLKPEATREPMQWSPEMSRRGRAIEVWAALRSLGRSGLRDLIERTCRHATRFADGLTAAGFTVLNDVELNQVLVAFSSDAHTERVIAAVQRGGTCWCGGTRWRGRVAMRISVSSWATTDADVELSLAAIINAAAETGRPA